jgi:hypothetical protein
MNIHNVSSIVSEDTSSTGGHQKITHMTQDRLETNRSKSEFSAFKLVTPTGQTGITPVTPIYIRLVRPIGYTG